MGEVGNTQRHMSQLFLDQAKLFFPCFDGFSQGFHGRHGFFGRLLATFQTRDFFRSFFKLMPEILDQDRLCSAMLRQPSELFPRDILAARSQLLTQFVEIVSQYPRIVHAGSF
ncbi:MAG: hypothetical protein K0S45_1454 [Nitrospira sp.]|nr:hypothetical protein [Nitrospira sp.]